MDNILDPCIQGDIFCFINPPKPEHEGLIWLTDPPDPNLVRPVQQSRPHPDVRDIIVFR